MERGRAGPRLLVGLDLVASLVVGADVLAIGGILASGGSAGRPIQHCSGGHFAGLIEHVAAAEIVRLVALGVEDVLIRERSIAEVRLTRSSPPLPVIAVLSIARGGHIFSSHAGWSFQSNP